MYIQIIYKNIIIPSRLLRIKPESRGYFNFINNDWIVPEQRVHSQYTAPQKPRVILNGEGKVEVPGINPPRNPGYNRLHGYRN